MTCSHIILTAARARVTEEAQLRPGRLVCEERGVHLCYYGCLLLWMLLIVGNANNEQEATQR